MNNTKGYLCLFAAVLIELFNGVFYLWANISVYILSYIYIYDKNVNADAIYYVDMASTFLTLAGYQIGAYLINERQWNPKCILALGGSIAFTGIFAASFTTNLTTFVILYGACAGIGCGINYLIPFVCVWKYFPENKGLVTGIISGAYGMGNLIFSYLSTSLVNPNDAMATIYITDDLRYFEEDVAEKVPQMLRKLCSIWII
jgi:MFS transporter, OFA family, oxalate/formate antiporter